MRARPSTTAPYDMSGSAMVQKLFAPGPQSFERIKAYRNAVGDPAAMKAMEGYAVDRLRTQALRQDGTLDPARVEAFRRQHTDALRALPALDARFASAAKASETLADVSKARKVALDNAQKGVLGKILGLEDASDVVRTVGSVFTAQDAAKRMSTLRKVIGDDKEAQQGLRKAVVDHVMAKFVGNTEAGTSGLGTIKADGFQTFVRQNQVALRTAGFSADELNLMGRIAEDLQRANRSIAAVKLPGGSNTVQDALQVGKGGNARSILAKSLIGIGAGGGAMVGGGFTAALGAVGAKAIGDMRMAGIEKVDDILADALLNPGRARLLLTAPTTKRSEEQTWQMLGALYRRSVAVSGASSLDGNGSGTERRQPVRIDVTQAAGGMAR